MYAVFPPEDDIVNSFVLDTAQSANITTDRCLGF